jgi:capsular polysaccharide biosynthesis protein
MEQGLSMDIREILNIIKKRMLMIELITLAFAVTAGVISFYVMKPVYESKTSFIISKPMSETTPQTYNDVLMYQNLIKTYSAIAESKAVSKLVAGELNSKYTVLDLQESTSVTSQANTQILLISVRNKNPQDALNIVKAMSDAFINESTKLFSDGGVIKVMDEPELPTIPVKPNKKLNIAIGFILGLMVSSGLAFIFEYMDKTIKTENDVDKYLDDIPVLGIIPMEAKR